MKSKKILIAGGAGFIGSHLSEMLVDEGHSVTVIDSLITGRLQNIANLISKKKISFVEADIRNPLPEMGVFDQIFNLASPASPKDFASIGLYILETSSFGHRNLLNLAKTHEARILFASTSEVYGDPLVHPQNESYYGNVNPIGARACYDEAKRFGETLSTFYRSELGVDTCIARIFNTYGPHMSPQDGRILPNFFTQSIAGKPLTIYGDGQQTRSYCFVSDMTRGLVALMNSSETTPVNLGNPIERTVKEIAEKINQMTGNPSGFDSLPLPENDPKKRRPDITKAQKKLQWEPKVDLETGLEKTYLYFKSVN